MMNWLFATVDVPNWTWTLICLCACISMIGASVALSYASRRLREAIFHHEAAQSIYNEILGEDE